ncbi:GntR family transcriptional regulator [Halocella sp. SP3-1]|uniref:GntR family transcriptional regulator n=1 Tax=Halocella sp. SP3-1 TaxID=2382161 RepID=UPI000F7654C3|nr:GntR family transcriptional regulator [Halocella sp. SP3-1]AZO96359.1 GntR family transcriptional regulator [Halocella sp. SP3-1]
MKNNKKLPKYEKIKLDLIKKINNSELKPNQIIPSENELCDEYGVSRVTVRKSIDELVLEGYLYKMKGKGSFVKAKSPAEGIPKIHSFTEAILHQGKTPSKLLISLTTSKPENKIADKLNINIKDDVYIIKCLYSSNGNPFCLNKSILPQKLFPKLNYFDLSNNSLYEILKSFYNLNFTRATQTINATTGNYYIYNKLNADVNTPLLKINATSFCIHDSQEIPFEIYESFILTDIMSYYVEKFN